jgi:hypothetical protein
LRGQVTLEFLGTVAMAVLIFAVLSVHIMTQFSLLVPWNTQSPQAAHFAQRIASYVNYAYLSGDGYSSSFELPEQIAGRDYVVYYNSTNRVIEVDIVDLGAIDSFAVVDFVAPRVVMGAGPGTNYVTNSNGTVAVRR